MAAAGGGACGASVASGCDEACGETCCDEPEPVAVAAEAGGGGGREGSVGRGGTLPVADGGTAGIILFGPVVPSEGFVEAAGGMLLEEGVEGGIPLGAGTGGWACGLTDGEEPATVPGGAAAELGGAAVAAAAGTPGTPGPPAVDGVGGCL